MDNTYESLLKEKRGYVARWPEDDTAVVVVSGGLDSISLAAWLLEEKKMKLFPLHIQRGQTNAAAELASVAYFEAYFRERYPDRYFPTQHVKMNVPPMEFKPDLIPYMKQHGYPVRDPMLHLVAVQYACAVRNRYHETPKTVLCAIVPEDYFPHSTLLALRATTVAVCENLGDWDWTISSPNIDPFLRKEPFGKSEEIQWATAHGIPIGKTVSCNDAKTLNCGRCSSCTRRRQAFARADVADPTEYENAA